MAKRTELLCIHEGTKGSSTDPIFINRLIKSLDPAWIRPAGSNSVRLEACGGRTELIGKMPGHLRICLNMGGNVTLMVWADVDDESDPDALKKRFWEKAQDGGITGAQFDRFFFVFARNRIENWIEYLNTGKTDESKEGPRATGGQAAKRRRGWRSAVDRIH